MPPSLPTSPPHANLVAPAPFPWQAGRWEECLRLQHTGRIHHAFLLRGISGNGKHAFAMRWANALICEDTRTAMRPCGICRGCILFGAGTHPDVEIVESPPGKRNIGIDQIREVIEHIWLSRQFASWKPVVVPGAECMTISAANTLLKTLEEPPGKAVFILITDRSDRLPITVRSRCRFLDFPIPPKELVLPWLAEQLPPSADTGLLLAASGGAPLLALRYGEGDTLQQRTALHKELTMLLTGKANPMIIAARWKTLGCAVVLPWILSYVIDLIRLRFREELQPTLHSDDAAALRRLAGKLDSSFGYRLLDRCLETRRVWEDSTSLNELLLLEGLAIDFTIYDS